MDTISRENNSILPIAGVIAGALALLLAVVALFKLSSAGKEITLLKEDLNSRIGSVEAQVTSAVSTADRVNSSLSGLRNETNGAFAQVATELGSVRAEITKVQESLTKPKAAAGPASGKAAKEPAVAGPDEYIVKAGDVSGTKIAKANGVSIADLQAVNPGVNWSKLKIGDKLKLPRK